MLRTWICMNSLPRGWQTMCLQWRSRWIGCFPRFCATVSPSLVALWCASSLVGSWVCWPLLQWLQSCILLLSTQGMLSLSDMCRRFYLWGMIPLIKEIGGWQVSMRVNNISVCGRWADGLGNSTASVTHCLLRQTQQLLRLLETSGRCGHFPLKTQSLTVSSLRHMLPCKKESGMPSLMQGPSLLTTGWI